MIVAYLEIYQELLSLAAFFRVHSNSKEVSYLSWQNTYPNLKTICHIKLTIFLWTKLVESLLLVQYLISVAATLFLLNKRRSNQFHRFSAFSVQIPSKLSQSTCSEIKWKPHDIQKHIQNPEKHLRQIFFLINFCKGLHCKCLTRF